MTHLSSTSNQRKISDTEMLLVSAIQKISDLYESKDFRGLTGQVAVAFGVLPKAYDAADGESYNLPINNAKMTFGATDFGSSANFGIISVGALSSEACMALGKLNYGEIVKYVVINKEAAFVGANEADLTALSVKGPNGETRIAALTDACDGDSYVHCYLMN